MTIIPICEWTGTNFGEILRKISLHNTETLIKVIGNRVIIKDNHADFYQSVVIGDMVEIPIYPECLICDEADEEDYIQPKNMESTEQLMKDWNL